MVCRDDEETVIKLVIFGTHKAMLSYTLKMDAGLRVSFSIGVLISLFVMKTINIVRAVPHEKRDLFKFMLSPLFTIESWDQSPEFSVVLVKRALNDAIKYSLTLVFCYFIFWKLFNLFPLPRLMAPYLATFPALFAGEALGPWLQIFCSVSGKVIGKQHNSPLLSKSISEFWGSRWNLWTGDWFKRVIFKPLSKTPSFAALVVFVFSGVWHEAVINVPAKLFYQMNFFGGMILYFLLQWLGIAIERILLKDHILLKRVFTWIVIVGPVPLILNEVFLRIIFLWPFRP